jgi:hypothetical protein
MILGVYVNIIPLVIRRSWLEKKDLPNNGIWLTPNIVSPCINKAWLFIEI